LGLRTRENQREWYGKRGISLHGFLVIVQVAEGQRKTEVIDLWSEDTKQDAWFTQSALDIGFRWLETAYPGFSVYLFSDNGPHYHNSAVLFYLSEVNRVFNFTIKEYNNFEAGEGKSQLDSHFAHISHKIVRWVRLGNDLESGEQVAELIKVECSLLFCSINFPTLNLYIYNFCWIPIFQAHSVLFLRVTKTIYTCMNRL